MKAIKKVAVTPVADNIGTIIDSFNTTDDKHTNAPSINAVNNRIDSKFVTLIGSFNVSVEEGATFMSHTENINYPSGFTVNNTVVLSIGVKNASQQLLSYSFGTLSDTDATGFVSSSFGKGVVLNDDNMQLKIYFNFGASHQATSYMYNYKITLMKVDPDVSNYELGDINMDGEVTQADLTLLQNFLLGTQVFTDKQFKLADMNQDGVLDSADLNLLNKKIQGNS